MSAPIMPAPDLLVECAQGFVEGWSRSALEPMLHHYEAMESALSLIRAHASSTPWLTQVELGRVMAKIAAAAALGEQK